MIWLDAERLSTQHSELSTRFIDIAPQPPFPPLERAHDGVFRAVEVFRGVLVLRRVAAADVAAGEAEAQVYPGVALRDALLAAFGRVRRTVNLVRRDGEQV